MKRFIGLVAWLLTVSVGFAQNLVFNPCFDMTPWDTGWTIESLVDTHADSGTEISEVYARATKDTGASLPNSCHLRAKVSAYNSQLGGNNYASGTTEVVVYQNFEKIYNCIFKSYVKYKLSNGDWYFFGHGDAECDIQLCINGEWQKVWRLYLHIYAYDEHIEDTLWGEVCTTVVNDTVSGIKFHVKTTAYASGYPGMFGYGDAKLWVDDVYIGELGVEDKECRAESKELIVHPNPFFWSTAIKHYTSQAKVRVYDMIGRLVEETDSSIVGKNLAPGVYFIKINGYRPIKIVKLGGV